MSAGRRIAWWLGAGLLLPVACGGQPTVPEHPTWADVRPIVAGECTHCHGATASTTGSNYRLDFYDMTTDVCGEAARALPTAILAATAATEIVADVTPSSDDGRARMPPAPAPALHDWERETLLRWAAQPVKGPAPSTNHPPTIQVSTLPTTVSSRLSFSVLVEDADGDPVVGVLKIAGAELAMKSAGSFFVDLPSASWPAGPQALTAVLCDGWVSVPVDVGTIQVQH